MLSKKLLGLSFVFFVIIALTFEPDFTNFLKISNLIIFQAKNTSIYSRESSPYQLATVTPESIKFWPIKHKNFGIRLKSTGTKESTPMQSNSLIPCPRVSIAVSFFRQKNSRFLKFFKTYF